MPCPLLAMTEPGRLELAEVWLPTAERLRGCVGESTFNIWLAELHLHALEDGRLLLGAPDTARPWITGRFNRALSACAGMPWHVEACAGVSAELTAIGATA